jgi:hypothetical protein
MNSIVTIKTKIKMKNLILTTVLGLLFIISSCESSKRPANISAKDEQAHTEENQRNLNEVQPAPRITWSLERDNLIKRFKLQNDRSVLFYMYVFIEGISEPIGYYQINKVSSVNSQLTNPEQIICNETYESGNYSTIPSPSEDGSYGTNGDAVFGFTPEEIYIEHNMKYICSTVPLSFGKTINRLVIVNVETQNQLKTMMNKLK